MSIDVKRMFNEPIREKAVRLLSEHLTDQLLDLGVFRSCLNCSHWIDKHTNGESEFCGLYDQRPPAKVIVTGCEKHTDLIPFD